MAIWNSLAARFSVAVFLAVTLGSAARAQPPGDVSGTWSGTIVITMPDGKVAPDKAVLVLQQNGAVLTGTAGASIDKQSAIENGKVGADGIRFHVSAGGGMDFHLQLEQGALRGDAVANTPRGAMTARLEAIRAPGLAPLRDEILAADTALFAAYNACDVAKFGAAFTPDLEFYHDKTGLTGLAQNVEALRQRCAETVKYRRQLDAASVEVYPVPGYGAMEFGVHSFFEHSPGGAEKLDATVKFANLWKRQDGGWKLARVISYDHR